MPELVAQNRFAVVAVILFGIGLLNMMLQQNLVKKVIGLSIMDSAIFMLLASLGYIEGHGAPIVEEGAANASLYINPIPSGLVLTGIVVSVSWRWCSASTSGMEPLSCPSCWSGQRRRRIDAPFL